MSSTPSSQAPERGQAAEQPILEAVGVTKHFPVRSGWRRRGVVHAAEDISVALHPGRVTAIVGESGSGKSTLSRMLARTYKLTDGKLYFRGAEVNARSRASSDYRRAVQLVLQDPFASLNPVHSVRYILGRPLTIHGRDGGDLEAATLALLRRVALEPAEQFIDKYPHELSGGQRQRVSIARGLAVQPEVLLADEPVSMLDVSIRLGVLNLLADLRDRDRLAILYVTHDIASARYLADTIMVMYAGRVVEAGPAAEVTDHPTHPYTQLLLSAAPDPDAAKPTWAGAAGAPPSLVNPPSGCRFHPRCPHAMDVCRSSAPPLLQIGPPRSGPASGGSSHQSACWLHDSAKVPQPAPAAPEPRA